MHDFLSCDVAHFDVKRINNIQDHRVGDDRIGFKIGPTADSVCIRWLFPSIKV